jgi:hypothetical protein
MSAGTFETLVSAASFTDIEITSARNQTLMRDEMEPAVFGEIFTIYPDLVVAKDTLECAILNYIGP